MVPNWLSWVSVVSLILAGISAVIIIADLSKHPQHMAVMNWVWPITALYFGPVALWTYFKTGRQSGTAHHHQHSSPQMASVRHDATAGSLHHQAVSGHNPVRAEPNTASSNERKRISARIVVKAATHCGAGCTIGDIIGEWIVFAFGMTIAGIALWPEYLLDFSLAYLLGILVQYFSIAPMRSLSFREGLWAALKADTLSLLSFEIGLFGWMALCFFVFFHPHLKPTNPAYWFMMQLGMIIGFLTSIPANAFLLKRGIKEAM